MNWKALIAMAAAIAALSFPATLHAQTIGVPEDGNTLLTELNLTEEQQSQLEHIRALAKAQLQELLTPQQWQQLQDQANGAPISMASLNLSQQQMSQLNDIQALMSERFFAMLTPEQLQKLQELMPN